MGWFLSSRPFRGHFLHLCLLFALYFPIPLERRDRGVTVQNVGNQKSDEQKNWLHVITAIVGSALPLSKFHSERLHRSKMDELLVFANVSSVKKKRGRRTIQLTV
jgi:hypothetical protein